jgi:hypothetical protein
MSTQAERENLINSLIIDNTTMQVSPAKVRQVLFELNNAIGISDVSGISAIVPLYLDPYTNTFSISKASETVDGYISHDDFIKLKESGTLDYKTFPRLTVATQVFEIPSGKIAKYAYSNGAIWFLNNSDLVSEPNTFTQSGMFVTFKTIRPINNLIIIFFQSL